MKRNFFATTLILALTIAFTPSMQALACDDCYDSGPTVDSNSGSTHDVDWRNDASECDSESTRPDNRNTDGGGMDPSDSAADATYPDDIDSPSTFNNDADPDHGSAHHDSDTCPECSLFREATALYVDKSKPMYKCLPVNAVIRLAAGMPIIGYNPPHSDQVYCKRGHEFNGDIK